MRFEDILPALREGKKARRAPWHKDEFVYMENGSILRQHGGSFSALFEQINVGDWEIVEEKPQPTLKKVVFKEYCWSPGGKPGKTRWISADIEVNDPFWTPLCDEHGNQNTKTDWVRV